jgi:cell wall-associated NlpC family hydrolase
MKWMIAATLAGSTAIAPVAINEVEMKPEIVQFDFVEKNTQEFTLPVDPEVWAAYHRRASANEMRSEINAYKAMVRAKRMKPVIKVLDELKSYVGKTPYVFSGASPRAWDCSGLVMWTYAQLGIELPHSASAQLSAGKHVNNPQPGDIVVWGGGYHSGIYLGEGKVINALNPRVDTNIMGVNAISGSITYVRVYDY